MNQLTKHIIITSDRKKNNVSVYSQEPAVVVVADREDMNSLKVLDEANQAGIYILIGETQRYVGQASNEVYRRLVKHDNDQAKKWWTKVIFFGREDGRLDKSQTDYLEKKLIDLYLQTNFKVENGTIGNDSYIDKVSRINADNIWYIVQEILEEVANINLFDSTQIEECDKPVVAKTSDAEHVFTIRDANGNEFVNTSAQGNYIEFVRAYYHNPEYHEHVARLVVQEKATSVNILGSEKNIVPSGQINTIKLDTNVYLYKNYSTRRRKVILEKFADQIGVKVEINWP